MKRVHRPGLALLLLALTAASAAGAGGAATPPPAAAVDVRPGETILTFPARAAADAPGTAAGMSGPDARFDLGSGSDLGSLVALPPDARHAEAVLLAGEAAEVSVSGDIMRLRGSQAVAVRVRGAGRGPVTVAVRHDGSWASKADDRLASPALAAGLPGMPSTHLKSADYATGGSYVIITGPQFLGAIAPLADWKTRKGWPVVTVTTDETGTTNAGILAWLREAYDTWPHPPEYVLLVGDVDAVPSWDFSGNVTDLPYSHLDGDDWLPDVMLGRFSVSNQTECNAMVAKTVTYEQTPYTDQPEWFTRGVMVAGQYSSSTPKHTVWFCGEQLESIGFDTLDPVLPLPGDLGNYIVSPYQPQDGYGIPQNLGGAAIKLSIDAGCSMVVYRGWAYGTRGWEPPHYTVEEIPQLANGAMTPVVMSFVCLNGDFSASEPCFGEVFTRTGGVTQDAFKGAVAFIGNGEHWSHTRFNDAMAISFFERIVDPELTTLGSLLNAGKLRFLEYFPGELDDQGDEFSVEFYFHIYNLLGDPELNYHRALPTTIAASHLADVSVGATLLDVAAHEADGTTPLPGARIGVAQAGVLLGAAITGDDGTARVVLGAPVADGPVDLTVTHADRLPYLAQLNGAAGGAFLGLDALAVDDGAPAPGEGNGDGTANPGEQLALTPSLRNLGSEDSGAATLTLSLDGPASVETGTTSLPGLIAGATGSPAAPLIVAIPADAADGAVIGARLAAQHDGATDLSGFELIVSAPALLLTATTADGAAWVAPGATTELDLTVHNTGTMDTAGGSLALALGGPDGITLLTGAASFGAVAAGGSASAGSITVQVDADVAGGATSTIIATVTCDEGAVQTTSLPLPVGDGAVGEPTGPDRHGYYAYDSADYLYPDQRPVYRWQDISTQFGGAGTKLPFEDDNLDVDVAVDLPFTFTYYGEVFDRVRVSDNGWISFEDANDFYNFYNWPLPSAHGNGAVVAPFWDNLSPDPATDPDADPVGLDSDGVYWYHDAARSEVVFEWSRMRHVYPDTVPALQTFQVVLRDPAVHDTPTGDGEILFYYRQVADVDYIRMYASIGIESPDETDGLQLSYDQIRAPGTLPFGPGGAVKLTTAPPVRVPLTVSSLQRRDDGGRASLEWTLTDDRPVIGWRVVALRGDERVVLGGELLPAGARRCEVTADEADDLILEAVLPHGTLCEAGKASVGTTAALALGEARPNPVRGETSIAFALPRAGSMRLRVFDVRGRCVRTLVDGRVESGEGLVVWRGRDDRGRQLADGVYFYRLEHAGQTLTRKLLLVR